VRKVRKRLTAWLQGAAELMLFCPALVAVHVAIPWSKPPFLAELALMSVVYALGFAFHDTFKAVKHWQSAVAALLVPAVAAGLASGTGVAFPIPFILLMAAWIRGRQNRLRGWDRSFPAGAGWIGMIGYFFASVIFPRVGATEPYAPWMTGLGIAALALTLYRTNSSTLIKESLPADAAMKPSVAADTRRRNQALMLGLFAVIVVIGSIRPIAEAIAGAGRALLAAVVRLVKLLLGLLGSGSQEPAPPPAQPQPDMDALLPPGEPSAFAVLLEKLLFGVVIVLLAAAAVGLLYFGGKWAAQWLKRAMRWYGERLTSGDEMGYTDERQQLIDGREWARERAELWKRRIAGLFRREPGWDDLPDNRERARHAYRRLLLMRIAAGYEHDAARTPRETGRELTRHTPLSQVEKAAIELYEEARYGGKDVPDERAAELKKLF
jgi:uncharacterized membrane protein YqaE (UPF0057 family)